MPDNLMEITIMGAPPERLPPVPDAPGPSPPDPSPPEGLPPMPSASGHSGPPDSPPRSSDADGGDGNDEAAGPRSAAGVAREIRERYLVKRSKKSREILRDFLKSCEIVETGLSDETPRDELIQAVQAAQAKLDAELIRYEPLGLGAMVATGLLALPRGLIGLCTEGNGSIAKQLTIESISIGGAAGMAMKTREAKYDDGDDELTQDEVDRVDKLGEEVVDNFQNQVLNTSVVSALFLSIAVPLLVTTTECSASAEGELGTTACDVLAGVYLILLDLIVIFGALSIFMGMRNYQYVSVCMQTLDSKVWAVEKANLMLLQFLSNTTPGILACSLAIGILITQGVTVGVIAAVLSGLAFAAIVGFEINEKARINIQMAKEALDVAYPILD